MGAAAITAAAAIAPATATTTATSTKRATCVVLTGSNPVFQATVHWSKTRTAEKVTETDYGNGGTPVKIKSTFLHDSPTGWHYGPVTTNQITVKKTRPWKGMPYYAFRRHNNFVRTVFTYGGRHCTADTLD